MVNNNWVDGDVVESKEPPLQVDAVYRLLRHNKCLRENMASAFYLKQALANKMYYEAKELWIELSEEEQTSLFIAPSKGGIFTTEERKIIKSGFKEE